MATQKRGAKNPISSAFAAKWLSEMRDPDSKDKKTWDHLAKTLGCSRTALIQIGNERGGVGPDIESKLAEMLAGGSIDEFRRQAKEYWDAHPEVQRAYLMDNLLDADPIPERGVAIVAARLIGYSEEAIDSARDAEPGKKLTSEEWIDLIRNAHKLIASGVRLK